MITRASAESDEIQAGKLLADHARYRLLVDRAEASKTRYGLYFLRSWKTLGAYLACNAALVAGIHFFLPPEMAYAFALLMMTLIPILNIVIEVCWHRTCQNAFKELKREFPNGWPTRHI